MFSLARAHDKLVTFMLLPSTGGAWPVEVCYAFHDNVAAGIWRRRHAMMKSGNPSLQLTGKFRKVRDFRPTWATEKTQELGMRVSCLCFSHLLSGGSMFVTFVLFLLMLLSPVLALAVFCWGIGILLLTRRRTYGFAVLATSLAGGIGSLLVVYALGLIFDFAAGLDVTNWLVIFAAGFGIFGGMAGALGFLAPLFSGNNRWFIRRWEKT